MLDRKLLRKIRCSIKRELGRHDWASARTPSGEYLRRVFTRKILDRLSSGNKKVIFQAAAQWDYVKRYVWKEEIKWAQFCFLIRGPDGFDLKDAKDAIIDLLIENSSKELCEKEDKAFYNYFQNAGTTI